MRRLLLTTAAISWAGPAFADDLGAGAAAVMMVLLIAIGLVVYFLPSLLAGHRDVSGGGVLFALNIFLGWTVLFWIVCLIWAAIGKTKDEDAYYHMKAQEEWAKRKAPGTTSGFFG